MDTGGSGELLTAYKDKELLVFKEEQQGANGEIKLLPRVSAPRYKRIEACISWLEPKHAGDYAHNWIVAVGEREDGIYTALEEACGDLYDIAAAAISMKDRYLIPRIYIDDTQTVSVSKLRDPNVFDGLCGYDQSDINELGLPVYTHDADYWPTFRDRFTSTAIIRVPDDVRPSGMISSVYEQLRYLVQQKRFKWRTATPRVAWLLRQEPPLDKVYEHPLLKALCWLLTIMERTREDSTKQQRVVTTQWYGNPR